jgi:mono/diheme cytochrome c family protein
VLDAFYDLLLKIGFTDPPHALLTHMPIGLITGALLFFLVAVIFRRKVLVPTARHVFILAFIFIFPTILFGVLDWLHYFKGVLMTPIKFKIGLAAAVLVITGAGVILGSELKVHTIPQMVLYALAFVCVVGLGYFGAKLVYGGWSGEGATTDAPAGQEAAYASGSEAFAANCQACHPKGGNAVYPSLPLKGSQRLASLEGFTAFLRSPTMPDGSPGSMPPFGEELISSRQAEDLYLYVSHKAW